MMAALRAGLIGVGMMGRHHARVLADLSGVDLVGVCDPAGDRHRAVSGAPVVETLEQLLAHDLHYCVVATPTVTHEQIAAELARAGVNAMIEKPLGADAAAARRIAALFTRAGLLGAVGHIERFNPALQQARARLSSGQLGRVFQVVTRRQGPFPGRIADVGVTADLGTHDFDITAWVTQQPYTSITAHTANRSGRDHEDLIAAVGLLADGTVTDHLVNWLSPFKERQVVITGEHGAFLADTLTADLTYYANGVTNTAWSDLAQFRGVSEGDVVRYALNKREPLLNQHEAFRDALNGNGAEIVTMEQGSEALEVVDAALHSARTGGTVTLPTAGRLG